MMKMIHFNLKALKKYKLGFDVWGLLLFLIIMLPNFIWFAFPAPNDILRTASVTETLDIIASICQVLIITLLCVLINCKRNILSITPLIAAVVFSCVLYFMSWIIYYNGITNAFVIFGLTVPPCLAFLFFAIDRKNWVAVFPIAIFTICHLIYGAVNFIII